jgi:RecA-family ATPase
MTLAELDDTEMPMQLWLVPTILAEGVAILAGKPKVGKSWLALDIAIAVATGGHVLGDIEVEKGAVLYLGLEDTQRRMQDRVRQLLQGESPPDNFHFATSWHKLHEGGLEALDEFLLVQTDERK